MNTITSGIKNWKTTIIGIVLAVLLIMQDTSDLSNWKEWVFPALLAVFGILQRDADKSSEKSGIVPLLVLGLTCSFMFTSCGGMNPQSYSVNTEPYKKAIEANPEAVTMKPEHVTPIGGFQASFGATVQTDQGEFNVSESGLSGNVVVDLRSGK